MTDLRLDVLKTLGAVGQIGAAGGFGEVSGLAELLSVPEAAAALMTDSIFCLIATAQTVTWQADVTGVEQEVAGEEGNAAGQLAETVGGYVAQDDRNRGSLDTPGAPVFDV